MRSPKLHQHTLVKFIVSRFPNRDNTYPDNLSVRELGTMDGYVLSGRLCSRVGGLHEPGKSCLFHDTKLVIENVDALHKPLRITFVKKYGKRFIQSAKLA